MSELTKVEDVQPRAQSALRVSPIYALREPRVEQTGDALLISGLVASSIQAIAQEVVRDCRRRDRSHQLDPCALGRESRQPYSFASIVASQVLAVSGRGLFRPPPITTSRLPTIAARGASTFSGKLPTNCQASACGSYQQQVAKHAGARLRGCSNARRPAKCRRGK